MDLTNTNKWSLAYSGLKQITDVQPYASIVFFNPIPELRVSLSSPIVSVFLRSESASPNWNLGAWASLYTPGRKGSYVLDGERRFCRLNNESQHRFIPSTELLPYALSLQFPQYLEDVFIEVWEYIGAVSDSNDQILSRLEKKVNLLVEKGNV